MVYRCGNIASGVAGINVARINCIEDVIQVLLQIRTSSEHIRIMALFPEYIFAKTNQIQLGLSPRLALTKNFEGFRKLINRLSFLGVLLNPGKISYGHPCGLRR
jgi:hypothetical protein